MIISGIAISGATRIIHGTPVGTSGHQCMGTVMADIITRIMYPTGIIITLLRGPAVVISHKQDALETVISFSPVEVGPAVEVPAEVQQW